MKQNYFFKTIIIFCLGIIGLEGQAIDLNDIAPPSLSDTEAGEIKHLEEDEGWISDTFLKGSKMFPEQKLLKT